MSKIAQGIAIAACVAVLASACSWSGKAGRGQSASSPPAASSSPSASPAPSAGVSAPEPDSVERQVSAMTMEEKLGQLLLSGVEGKELGLHARELVETYRVGGFILYKDNIRDAKQLVAFVNALKSANGGNRVPLWLGLDEEGGRVSRLPAELDKLPSNQKLGAINEERVSYEIGRVLGAELQAFGFQIDFAPVLDINSNPRNPVIGDRSFGANADVVSRLGVQTMKGIQAERTIPVVKHFPGHGDTAVDSHKSLPVVQSDMTRLRELELVPFREAIQAQADAVMVAHLLLPKLDPEAPASLSKPVITGLLRGELGFQGVVMTDDLTMGAITSGYGIDEAAVAAILAGADVLLVGHGYDNAIAAAGALRSAVKQGVISAERLDASVARVLRLKSKYSVSDAPVPQPDVAALNGQIRALLQPYAPLD